MLFVKAFIGGEGRSGVFPPLSLQRGSSAWTDREAEDYPADAIKLSGHLREAALRALKRSNVAHKKQQQCIKRFSLRAVWRKFG